MKILIQLLIAGCLMPVPFAAQAQGYPDRPVTLVVPFAAGGSIDTTTRIIAENMRVTLGQPIIIENIGGAAGVIASTRVAKARPDGYTIMTGIWSTHVANGALYKQYDVRKDFEPVALMTSNPFLILSRSGLPANNLSELIAWLKANPGKASQGTSGVGSANHLGGLYFQKATGTSFQFIPYRGLAPAMQDLVGGRIDIMFDSPSTSLPQVEGKTIKGYAVTAKKRLPAAPDIPTVDEAGLPGFYVSTWTALFAPKGTPQAIIKRLNDAAMAALADANVEARLAQVGQAIYPRDQQSPKALADLQAADIEKWWPIIKAANIKVQ
jgi:tripartite-type tricarboxylate transporter receptor subunit TctC